MKISGHGVRLAVSAALAGQPACKTLENDGAVRLVRYEPGCEADALVLRPEEAGSLPPDAAVLLVCRAEELAEQRRRWLPEGVMVCAEEELGAVLPQLQALCVQLGRMRRRANSLERRLDEAKLIERAKLLLMQRLNMTEPQAHRYIEKTAMDTGSRKREIAERIIRTYED